MRPKQIGRATRLSGRGAVRLRPFGGGQAEALAEGAVERARRGEAAGIRHLVQPQLARLDQLARMVQVHPQQVLHKMTVCSSRPHC